MITKKLIEERIKNFWGYGNLKSKTWFIGMEEGFHGNEIDLEKRLKITLRKKVIDLKNDMKTVSDHMKWFEAEARIQRTWKMLILILLVLDSRKKKDEAKIKDSISEYQRNRLGRLNANHCLLEFMPLPCKSTGKKDWIYKKFCKKFGIEYLASRAAYLKHIAGDRTKALRELIDKHKPTRVIFYSKSYKRFWAGITGTGFGGHGDVLYSRLGTTSYFIIPHPAYRKTRGNRKWFDIANSIKVRSKW